MPRPNSNLYLPSQPSCVTAFPAPLPPEMGFPTPTSPLAPLQILGGDGERVELSGEDGDDEDDDDDNDEFEDSDPTEVTATATEADSDGELSTTPRLQYDDQVTRARACQWCAPRYISPLLSTSNRYLG